MSGNRKLGDYAVDGLLGGLVAGVAMLVYLGLVGLALGDSPVAVMGLFSPSGNGDPVVGVFSHLAVSSIYGSIFGLLLWVFSGRLQPIIAGLLFGLLLFLVANFVIIPGTESTLAAFSPANLAIGHLIYGLVLGWRVRQVVAANSVA